MRNLGLISNSTLQTNQWYLITATRKNGIAKLYINANLDATAYYSFTPTNNHYNLKLGMSHSNQQSFSGKLDELRIYNWALEQEQISDIYNEQPTGISSKNEANTSISVNPNPNKGIFEISIKNEYFGDFNIDIYNSVGQRIFKNFYIKKQFESSNIIDLNNYNCGIYLIILNYGDKKYSKLISISK